MDFRQVVERTQALNLFWEREISKYLKTKPSAVLTKEEVLSLAEAVQAQRGGVSGLDLTDIWRAWADGYKELVKLAADTTRENARTEILEIYGVDRPISKASVER